MPRKEEACSTPEVSIFSVRFNLQIERADTLDPAENEERCMKEKLHREVEAGKTFVLLTLRASIYSEEN